MLGIRFLKLGVTWVGVISLGLPCLGIEATRRVSMNNLGIEGNLDSTRPEISSNGRYVVFESDSTNFAPGDTNAAHDVFLFDLETRLIERVSESTNGVIGNLQSGFHGVDVSADGRFVVFNSSANNLVSGDTNGVDDIFVRDRLTGVVSRVSVSSVGGESNLDSWHPSISSDGRFVAFSSIASNLVQGDSNGMGDIFLHDRTLGLTTLLSKSTLGTSGSGRSFYPAISGDGSRVAFSSFASDLVFGDSNAKSDVFVWTKVTNDIVRASIRFDGGQSDGDSGLYLNSTSLTEDGDVVVFSSDASLESADTNAHYDAYIFEGATNSVRCVSLATNGLSSNGFSRNGSLSGDGSTVAFSSSANNLVPTDTNGHFDIFARDLSTWEIRLISQTPGREQGNGTSHGTSLSFDGTRIAYWSFASNLVPGDNNGMTDAFVWGMFPEPTETAPTNVLVIAGELFDGGVSSLIASDDDRYSVFPDPMSLACLIELQGTAINRAPFDLRLKLETRVARPGLSMTVYCRNYASSTYQVCAGRAENMSDEPLTVTLPAPVSQFVSNSRAVRARVSWEPINDEDPAQDGWLLEIDQFVWLEN